MEVRGGLASSKPPALEGPYLALQPAGVNGKPGPRAALLDPAQCVHSGCCEIPTNGSAGHTFCAYETMRKTMALS